MLRYWRKLARKRRKNLTSDARAQVSSALDALRDALDVEDGEAARTHAFVNAERTVERHLQFKSAAREFVESIILAVLFALLLRAFVVEAFKIPTRSMVPTLLEGDHLFVNKFAYGLRVPFTTERLIAFGEPERGDVVVFVFPLDEARAHVAAEARQGRYMMCVKEEDIREDAEARDFIKRVIGLPGERVEMINHTLHINGEPIPRTELYSRAVPSRGAKNPPHIAVWAEERLGDLRYITISQRYPRVPANTILSPLSNGDFGPITVKPGHVFVMGDNRGNSSDSRCWGQVPIDNIKGEAMVIWWSSFADSGTRWSRLFTLIE